MRGSSERRPRRRSVLLGIAMLSGFFVAACGTTTPRAGGSSLSDVAEQAKKKPEEQDEALESGKPVLEPEPAYVYVEEEASSTWEARAADSPPASLEYGELEGQQPPPLDTLPGTEPPSRQQPLFFGLETGWSRYDGDELRNALVVELYGGRYELSDRRFRWEVAGVVEVLDQIDELDESFENPLELALKATARYYLTAPHTFTGIYVQGGLQTGVFTFRFRNPVDVDGREVGSEMIVTWTPFVGAGLALVQTPTFHLGASLTTGVKLFNHQTLWEALDNDLYRPSGYVKLGFDFSLGRFVPVPR